jgi:transposase
MLGKSLQQQIETHTSQPPEPLLKEGSFYAQLAQHGKAMFDDEAFAAFYDDKMGRPSIPPHLLCLLLLLQWYCGCSDSETIERSAYDLRWQAVLGLPVGMPLCARSTLEAFRDHLITNNKAGYLFLASIKEAKRAKLLKGPALLLALDTKPVLGRGAVQDTFNLIAEAIKKTAYALARTQQQDPKEWMLSHNLERYLALSLKGNADIDWSDDTQKNALLSILVADAHRLVEMAQTAAKTALPETKTALPEAQLLASLLVQDVEETTDATGQPQASIKEGTTRGRIPSVSDPEQRHGRKSASKRFTGSKADIACDGPSQIIVSVGDLAGDEPDAKNALSMVKQAKENTDMPVAETTGDCAYGSGSTRQEFAEAGQTLYAKVPQESAGTGLYPKSRFEIDLQNQTVTCPAGHSTSDFRVDQEGGRVFSFGEFCQDCPLRAYCSTSARGRNVRVHPQEARLREARAFQNSPEGRAKLRARVVVEHCLARLGNLGIGQARYLGRAKTRCQLLMCAAVANLRWTWNWEASQTGSSCSLSGSCGAFWLSMYRHVDAIVSMFVSTMLFWWRGASPLLRLSEGQENGLWRPLTTFRQCF